MNTPNSLFIPSVSLSNEHIVAGFSTRHGGDAPELLAKTAGFDAERIFTLTQVHSARVVRVSAAEAPADVSATEADAMVTTDADCVLAIQTADCVPVLIAHPERRVVAAAHAGWRGLIADVIGAAVESVAELASAPPSELRAAIGPAIGACCFEVSREVAEEISASVGTRDVILERKPRPHIDLPSSAKIKLEQAGVPSDAIEVSGPCTKCAGALLHSYRREGPGNGRQLSFIAIKGQNISRQGNV